MNGNKKPREQRLKGTLKSKDMHQYHIDYNDKKCRKKPGGNIQRHILP